MAVHFEEDELQGAHTHARQERGRCEGHAQPSSQNYIFLMFVLLITSSTSFHTSRKKSLSL